MGGSHRGEARALQVGLAEEGQGGKKGRGGRSRWVSTTIMFQSGAGHGAGERGQVKIVSESGTRGRTQHYVC